MFLMPQEAFGLFRVSTTAIDIQTGVYSEIARQDTSRVVLIISLSGNAKPACVTPGTGIAFPAGVVLGINSPPLELLNVHHGPLSQVSWYAAGLTNPTNVTVVEVFLDRSPCPQVTP